MPSDLTRKRTRLADYDYSQPGGYFFTVCAAGRRSIFSRIENGCSIPTELGMLIGHWQTLPEHFPSIQLDEFVIMPNHIHGIIFIISDNVGAASGPPTTRGTMNCSREVTADSTLVNAKYNERSPQVAASTKQNVFKAQQQEAGSPRRQ